MKKVSKIGTTGSACSLTFELRQLTTKELAPVVVGLSRRLVRRFGNEHPVMRFDAASRTITLDQVREWQRAGAEKALDSCTRKVRVSTSPIIAISSGAI